MTPLEAAASCDNGALDEHLGAWCELFMTDCRTPCPSMTIKGVHWSSEKTEKKMKGGKMLEGILIFVLAIFGGVGWYEAATGGIKLDNSVKTDVNSQTMINMAQTTIVDRDMRNAQFVETNVADIETFFLGLTPWQRRETRFSFNGKGGFFVSYPVPVFEGRTNTERLTISNTRGGPLVTNRTNY